MFRDRVFGSRGDPEVRFSRYRPVLSVMNEIISPMSTKILSKMQKVELLKQIAANPSIPSPPTVVLQVLDKASQQDCTIADLCKIIQVDPGLAGRILRIVNSATFGLSRPVTSIQRALAVVGLNSARLLVLSISFPEMQRKAVKFDPQWQKNYWKASVAGAIVARELSRRNRARDPEDDMAAGLLRDLGELILQQLFPDGYKSVLAEPADALINKQCEIEETHCGLDHAEVSAFILDRWRLPPEVTEAIRHHHNPDQVQFSSPQARTRAYLLQFATQASQLLQHPGKPKILRQLQELAQSQFKMTADDLTEFLKPLSQKIADFAGLLQVDIGESTDYESVFARQRRTRQPVGNHEPRQTARYGKNAPGRIRGTALETRSGLRPAYQGFQSPVPGKQAARTFRGPQRRVNAVRHALSGPRRFQAP